ncbi:hypothetical protein [Paraburkholderia youngii]|uniref:hypothetical protein n=1 Tax=Paraburkholderia youngii TaxID=2782701 RepID=UPI003D19FB4D
MYPYGFSYGHDDFWAALAARVKPFLGDVENTLGYHWMDLVEEQFSRPDFVVVNMALRYAGKELVWYVVEWFESASGVYEQGESPLAGESRDSCLAYVLERCNEDGTWPDGVRFDEVRDRTTFTLRGVDFATVYRLEPDGPVDSTALTRVESSLLALRRNGGSSEFPKRFRKWPGLGNVKANEERRPTATHWPCPAEWLMSAGSLLLKAGVPEPTALQRQQLAAAVFGAPSWNHLCGLVPAERPKSDWWSLYAPTVVQVDGSPRGYYERIYQGSAAAFLDFRARAAEALALGEADTAWLTQDITGYPELVLSPGGLRPGAFVMLSPATAVDPSLEWEQRVRFATRSRYIEGLRQLFLAGSSVDEKLAARAAATGMTTLVVDGPWRFYLRDGGTLSTDLLIAELSDESGNVAGSAAVTRYKGALYRFEDIDGLVLSGDYHGGMPVAILKGLSRETLRLLIHELPSTFDDIETLADAPFTHTNAESWRGDDPTARNIRHLLGRMTPAGATYHS